MLVLALVLLGFFGVQAQRGQEIPPFLRDQPTPQTVEMDGRILPVPDFAIAFPSGGGQEFVTRMPFGVLAVTDTDDGFNVSLRRFRDVFRVDEFFRSAPNPLLITEGLGRTPNGPIFDFAQSAPHLAFFCRLEINEKANFVIPAKFRLGGHSYWQDNLLR
jgi:hypothetical protein